MRLLLIFLGCTALCLGLTDLEVKTVAAIKQAFTNLMTRNANLKTVDASAQLQSQKASASSQLEQLRGDVLMEVTNILIASEGVEILPQLEALDIDSLFALVNGEVRSKRYTNENSKSPTSDKCTSDDPNCRADFHKSFRSVTGLCNNREQPLAGAAVTPVRRLIGKAGYQDGIGAVRSKSVTGSDLPSTRLISNRLHDEGVTNNYDTNTNHLHMQFGQFIAHDIIFMPSSVAPSGESLDCSSCNSSQMTPNCAPIPVPSDDAYFPKNGCIRLTRALNAQKGLGLRQQIDQNTHFLDLSAVYGSEECEAASVRSFQNGELKVFMQDNYVLPPQAKDDQNCQSKNPNYCFLAGDFRNSLHPGLIPLHVVYIKEHNRIARQLKSIKPHWDDETVFQKTRRIMIAQHQHHVYAEYLPKLLGERTMVEFDLYPKITGYTSYDASVNPSLPAEFAAAAFRFGHSQARKDIPRMTNTNMTRAAAVDLGNNIFYTESLYKTAEGGTESMLEGMFLAPAMKADHLFSFPIRNQLFEIRGQKASGVDLVAVNIMRGRDVGLLPYNAYSAFVGRRKATKWEDFVTDMGAANVEALKAVYKSVDDVDLYTGIVLEKPANGAMIGRTGAAIIANTFSALKKGDRFYYEHNVTGTDGLSEREVGVVRRSSLARVFCESSGTMQMVNRNIFDANSPRIPCGALSSIDLMPFVFPI